MLKKLAIDVWYTFVGFCISAIWLGVPINMLGNHYGFSHSITYNTWIYALDILLFPLILIAQHDIGKYVCNKIHDYFTL